MTRRHISAGLTGILVLALAAGCTRPLAPEKPGQAHKPKDVVARADGEKLRWQACDKRAHELMQDDRANRAYLIPKEREEEALQFYRRKATMLFINKTVMLNEAKRRSLQVTAEDRATAIKTVEEAVRPRGFKDIEDFFQRSPRGAEEMRREFEQDLFVDQLLNQAVRSKIQVTDADRDAMVREVSALRRDARKKVDDLRAQLLRGGDFAALAGAHSDDEGSKAKGGDLGVFARGRMEKVIEDAAFGQKLNEVGPVLETRRGFAILKVTARVPAKAAVGGTPATPETVRASCILIKTAPLLTGKQMDAVIQRKRYMEGLSTLLKELRAKAKVDTIYKDLVL